MQHLTRNDYAMTLALLGELERDCAGDDPAGFARHLLLALDRVVASEFSTLSVCHIQTGHRQVAGLPGLALSAADVEGFDRHFHEHPLVRFHGHARREVVRRLSDEVTARDFRRSALYADYYRRIGIDRVIAVPLLIDEHTLVSLVLNRSRNDFSDRERERLELLRPHLAFLYRQACRCAPQAPAQGPDLRPCGVSGAECLTDREREVLQWLAFGKTDAEIAALLGVSPRTVHKHLEHVYVKLGVETRTAAVMRALDIDPSRLQLH